MTGGCIFCGARPTTKTHVFRKAWLERAMPAGPDGYFIHRQVREGPNPFDVTWQRDSFDIQPHAACQGCNGGWMHDVEHRGENLVEPCVLGRGRTFPPNTHNALARWILMCMVVLDQTLGDPAVEQPVRDALMNEWAPPDDCHVWLAATNSAEDTVNAWPRPWLLNSPSYAGNAYFCTFRIKHFVAQGFIPLGGTPKDLTFDRIGANRQFVVQVWPSGGDAVWPPPSVLLGDQVENFSRAFER